MSLPSPQPITRPFSQKDLEALFPPKPLPPYAAPSALRRTAAQALLPAERIKVSEAAEKYRVVNNPGAYIGPWQNVAAPYMVEPMDNTQSRDFEAVVFCGPAQSFKTASLAENTIVHAIVCNQRRTRLIEKSQDAARRFSRERLSALERDCPEVARRKNRNKSEDNIHDKRYQAMTLELGWPSVNWLAGDPVPFVIMTDYDRFKKDVGGEGEPFDLARKRNTTFGSLGMTVAESSPSAPITRADWKPPEGSNEAPPVTGGILALYNRGDRRRFYWPCPHCGEFFEPDFQHLHWDETEPDIEAAADGVTMICPSNGCAIEPREKPGLLAAVAQGRGGWLPEGQRFKPDGTVSGTARRSTIASYWLKGPAAAMQHWSALVRNYLTAVAEFDATGKETTLQSTVNVDQGLPYLPAALAGARSADADELARRVEDYPLGVVPAPARFLTAWVDVQGQYFDGQVQAWGPGGECWVIDKFRVTRPLDEAEDRLLDPAANAEDWLPLIDRVITRGYPLAGDPQGGRVLTVKVTGIDMHGGPGVSALALDFWRECRKRGLGQRVRLTRGDTDKKGFRAAPRVVEIYPDSQRKDRHAGGRGEVPVLNLNVNVLKDEVLIALGRTDPGTAMVHFSTDLAELKDIGPGGYFAEVASESRTETGWNREHRRNEAWDQLVANRALWLWLKADRINWTRPPAWAADWDKNILVLSASEAAGGPQKKPTALAAKLA